MRAVLVLSISFFHCINSLNIDDGWGANDYQISSEVLHVPPLEELENVFKEALSKNYADVAVRIVDCPNLKKKPFKLAAPGIGGSPHIIDVGQSTDFNGSRRSDKVFYIKPIASMAGHGDKSFVIGAAHGPWPYLGANSEMIVNSVLRTNQSTATSRVAILDERNKKCVLKILPGNETRFSHTGNLFISKGITEKAIEVHVKRRLGGDSFIDTLQKALSSHYMKQLVGFGGTFVALKGKVEQHLLNPSLEPSSDVKGRFHRLNMSSPLVAVGTFLSDGGDLKLHTQHFHSFSTHGEGGHYCNDVSPDKVEYLGYFIPARMVYKFEALN